MLQSISKCDCQLALKSSGFQMDPQNPPASDFILDIPGCPSCSSCSTASRPFFGITTLDPHNTQPFSDESSICFETKAFKFSLQWLGQPCITNCKFWICPSPNSNICLGHWGIFELICKQYNLWGGCL